MKRVVVAIPHSHTWFWTQTCLSCLVRNPPTAEGCEVVTVVVNNSPWSPAIRGVLDTYLFGDLKNLIVETNPKSNKFHASALDHVVKSYDFDYLMALETDVMVLRPNWLQWFMDQLRPSDYAVGMWHHESFINPSCTLYNGKVLRDMNRWCKWERETHNGYCPQDELRWGPNFSLTAPLDNNISPGSEALKDMKSWIAGPFAEKRGFAEGTFLKETPSGQLKGPGWYEPGQQLHHWAVQGGYTYTICPTMTTKRDDGLPLQTLYGSEMPDPNRQLEAVELFGNAYSAHLWGGTRALDVLKHPVTCDFVKANTPMWLAREARYWKQVVPTDVQEQTLKLIREHGWHITGQGSDHVSDRDHEAAEYVKNCYAEGGVEW